MATEAGKQRSIKEIADQNRRRAIAAHGEEWSWPAAVPRPVGYSYYEFFKEISSANCRREYRIIYQPGLWSAHNLIRSWGRIGSQRPRHLVHEFEDRAAALAALERILARRLKRGYSVKWCEQLAG
jgi:predicted DNA-binding WGR domain protein